VDNASTDGSQAWLSQREDITFIESAVNTGFTGGNNLGALRAKGNRLLFINNDTRLTNGLDPLVDLLDDEAVGVAGCRLRYGDLRQQFSFGYEHTPVRLILSWLGLEKRHQLPSVFRRLETAEVEYQKHQSNLAWVSGACFVMRAEHWRALGGFDTRFFMYCEDVDLCLRARNQGKRIAYTPKSTVIHFEGAGRRWIGSAALRRTVVSYQLFSLKHFGYLAAVGVSLGLGGVFLLRSAVFWLQSLGASKKDSAQSDKAIAFFGAASLLLTSISKLSAQGPSP
jgi:GT2 family glycosyltransferase